MVSLSNHGAQRPNTIALTLMHQRKQIVEATPHASSASAWTGFFLKEEK